MSVALSLIFGLILLVCRAFVFKKLWLWFIVSAFPSVPPIAMGTAMGFSLMVQIIQQWKWMSKEELELMKHYTAADAMYTSLMNTLVQLILLGYVLGLSWLIAR